MKNVLKLLLLVILATRVGHSQTGNVGGHAYAGLSLEAGEFITNYDSNIKKFSDKSYTNLVGSIYINDEFSLAKIEGVEQDLQLRYDAYSDEMEMKLKEEVRYLLKKPNIRTTFKNTKEIYQLYSYKERGEEKKGFFVVLSESDKFSLLLKQKVKFYEEVKPATGYEKYVPPTLKLSKEKLFIGFKNGTTSEMPKNKKDFLNLFSSKSKEIDTFRKKNKLNIKVKEDLMQIFNYYNTLL